MQKYFSAILPFGLLFVFLAAIFRVLPALANPNEKNSGQLVSTPEQVGPPWYDPAWNYRRPVVVTNNSTSLPYYQVLIRLDINNFDFSRARVNGDDIRFTHSDGTTELKYWIETWDSADHLAFVWVRVPSLANGQTTIYMYYGNDGATSTSDGNTLFHSLANNWDKSSSALADR